MTDDMTFNVNLRIGNKKGFLSDIKNTLKGVSFGSAGSSSGGAGGGFLNGVFKNLGGVLGKLLGWVSIIGTAVSGLLGPIISIASQILKMIGEFLRPIADMVVILLTPILLLLRPIVMIVRGMMAPFRAAAYKLVAAGSKAFSEGDYVKGGLLFGLAFNTLTIGFHNMLLGFIGEVLKLVVDISGWIQKTISEVLFDIASKIASLLDKLIPGDQSILVSKISDAKTSFLEKIDVNAENIKKEIDTGIDYIKEQSLLKISTLAENLGASIELGNEAIKKVKTGGEDLSSAANNIKKYSFGGSKGPWLPGMATESGKLVSTRWPMGGLGVGPSGVAIANVVSGGNEGVFNKVIQDMQSRYAGGLASMKEETNTYMAPESGKIPTLLGAGFGLMESLQDTFNISTQNKFKNAIGPAGTITNILKLGFEEMSSSSNSFAKAMTKAAREVRAAVNAALDAASKAKAAKEKYERALKNLKDKRSD